MTDRFPFHRFAGSHFEVGRQHGEALRPSILLHLERLERRFARQGFTLEQAEEAALGYRAGIRSVSVGLDDEISGLSVGAGIPLGAAFLLQLRAEVFVELVGRHSAEQECTTFAILPERAGGGRGFVGQNADLPAMYHDLMAVVRIAVDGEPEVLMVLPAGQVSYIGINDAGLGVFANYLHCPRWREGFPRYLYTRVALRERTVASAEKALRTLHRASSRNIIMLDSTGGAVDLENTPETMTALHPENGVLVHANHYLHGDYAATETNPWVENSRIRYRRLRSLIEDAGDVISEDEIAVMLRDRNDTGDELSIHPEDDPRDVDSEDRNMTVASVIAEPGRGQMWVASGPPSRFAYRRFTFGAAGAAGDAGATTETARAAASAAE